MAGKSWQWFQRQLVRFGRPATSAESQWSCCIPTAILNTHSCSPAGVWQALLLPAPTAAVTLLHFSSHCTQRSAQAFKVLLSTPTPAVYLPRSRTKGQLFAEGSPSSAPSDAPGTQRLKGDETWVCLPSWYLFKSNDLWQRAEHETDWQRHCSLGKQV